MDGIELKNQTDEISEAAHVGRFNQRVAISVAIVAVFMTFCKVKDDNIVQAMMAVQAQELDQWNQFQAKSIKEHLYLQEIEQWRLRMDISPMSTLGRSKITGKMRNWDAEVARYGKEKSELKQAAQNSRKEYDHLNFRDDQFDLSDALCGLAIALFAVASLVQKKWLYCMGLLVAFGGVIMGLAGFFEWPIHPGIIRFLT